VHDRNPVTLWGSLPEHLLWKSIREDDVVKRASAPLYCSLEG
jgi:hypothetical protein